MSEATANSNTRYARQTLVPEIGPEGQARLGAARVLCIGAGGLGCASLPYLAGAGVGSLTIVDHDTVDRSNLQRQVLFGESDLGKPKATAAARRLADLNPDIKIEALCERLDQANVESLFAAHDLVIDGSDNYATKFLCGDASVKLGIPLVYASATGMEATIGVFDTKRGPCLRCLFPQPPTGWVPNCAEAGVLGPLVGMAGCVQAAEAIKWLVNGELDGLVGRVLWIDARDMTSRRLEVGKRPDCPVCSVPPDLIRLQPQRPTIEELDPGFVQEMKQTLLIDVREPEEYAAGHIPGAINLPLSRFDPNTATNLPGSEHVVIYCQSGPRALRAAELLAPEISGVKCLKGGIDAWNLPLGRGHREGCAPQS